MFTESTTCLPSARCDISCKPTTQRRRNFSQRYKMKRHIKDNAQKTLLITTQATSVARNQNFWAACIPPPCLQTVVVVFFFLLRHEMPSCSQHSTALGCKITKIHEKRNISIVLEETGTRSTTMRIIWSRGKFITGSAALASPVRVIEGRDSWTLREAPQSDT